MPTTTPPRRPRIEGDREAEVLDAAVAVLAEVGYDRLTMDQVALTARASKATLYRRWSSKAELVVDAVSRTKGLPDPGAPDTGTLRGDLLALAWGPHGQAQELPMSVLTGLLTALGTDDELSAAWRERFLAPRMAAAKAVFDRAARRGEVRHDLDLELVLTVVPSMCAFRCTVDAQVVDEDFLTRVLDQVLLPAVLARTDQTTLPVHGPPETEGTRT